MRNTNRGPGGYSYLFRNFPAWSAFFASSRSLSTSGLGPMPVMYVWRLTYCQGGVPVVSDGCMTR